MVREDGWREVHRLFHVERRSKAEIARHVGLDRKTVRAILQADAWQPYTRAEAADTLLTEHTTYLQSRAPQVQYSARILFQELRQSRGYRGSYETVKRFVRPLRDVEQAAERATVRFETPPGQQSQIDWGQARISLPEPAGHAARLHPDPGLLPAQLPRALPGRDAQPVPRCPRAGVRVFRRPHARASLRSAPHGLPARRRRTRRLERDLQAVRRLLGLRAPPLSRLPGADQGQGRVGREVLQAQFPPRPDVRRRAGPARAARPVAGRDRRRADPRHDPRAPGRPLRPRAERAHRHRRPARLPPRGQPAAARGRRLPRQLRDESLLGALHAHRPDRRGHPAERPPASSRIAGASSPSTRRCRASIRCTSCPSTARARSPGPRGACTPSPFADRAGRGALPEVEIRDLAIYDTLSPTAVSA